jgi:hypothetical protein
MGRTQQLGNYVNGIFQDASNNIGIGGSPSGSYKFEVTGTSKVSDVINAYNSDGNYYLSMFNTSNSNKNWAIIARGNNIAIREAGVADQMTFAAGGNVGIGTTTPSTLLHLNSTSTQLTLQNTDGGSNAERVGMFMTGGDTFKLISLNDNNTTRIDNILVANVLNGKIGIGNSAPQNALDINSSTPTIRYWNTGGSGLANTLIGGIVASNAYTNTSIGTAARIDFYSDSQWFKGLITFSTNGSDSTANGATERMRITSGGEVLIGGTSTTGAALSLYNPNAGGSGLEVRCSANSGNSVVIYARMSTVGSTSNYLFAGQDSQQDKIYIYGNGNVVNRNNSYGTLSSDIKLKQDIVDANSQWDDIKNLRVVNFRYIDDVQRDGEAALKQIGFIAQEVEEVSPSLVYETKSPESEDTWKSIKTSIIHLKALKALQETMAKIEQLEAKVSALENKS